MSLLTEMKPISSIRFLASQLHWAVFEVISSWVGFWCWWELMRFASLHCHCSWLEGLSVLQKYHLWPNFGCSRFVFNCGHLEKHTRGQKPKHFKINFTQQQGTACNSIGIFWWQAYIFGGCQLLGIENGMDLHRVNSFCTTFWLTNEALDQIHVFPIPKALISDFSWGNKFKSSYVDTFSSLLFW